MAKKKGNPTKKIFIFVGVLVVLLVVVGVGAKSAGLFGSKDKGTEVEFETIGIQTITQVVTASGRIQPEVRLVVACRFE